MKNETGKAYKHQFKQIIELRSIKEIELKWRRWRWRENNMKKWNMKKNKKNMAFSNFKH